MKEGSKLKNGKKKKKFCRKKKEKVATNSSRIRKRKKKQLKEVIELYTGNESQRARKEYQIRV